MPVEFNPPPFSTPDAGFGGTANAGDATAIAADAFALLLLAAAGGASPVTAGDTSGAPMRAMMK